MILSTISQARAAGRASACVAKWRATGFHPELLLAMGLRSFSMHPRRLPRSSKGAAGGPRRLAGLLPDIMSSEDPEQTCNQLLAGGYLARPWPSQLHSTLAEDFPALQQNHQFLVNGFDPACMTATLPPSLR